jgi:putative oxidoreductase
MTVSASDRRVDIGLLLLRGAALFLALTFGWQKLSEYIALIRAGQSLSNAGLAPLIRMMGFPAPAFLAICAVLNESVGALFAAAGLLTRLAAAVGALGMAAAFYVSLRLGEDPLRAALYLVIFLGLAITGPGKYSVDCILQSQRKGKTNAPKPSSSDRKLGFCELNVPAKSQVSEFPFRSGIDIGFLVLRLGVGLSFVLLFALKQSEAAKTFADHPGISLLLITVSFAAFSVVCGLFTRYTASLAALLWAWALFTGLRSHQDRLVLPVRAAQLTILFAALAFIGPRKFSLDHLLSTRRPTNRSRR